MNFKEEIVKSFETLRQMVYDRSQYDAKYKHTTIDQVSDKELEELSTKQIFSIDLSESIRVIYNMSSKYKLPDIKKYIHEEHHTYILILREKMSGTNIKSLAYLKDLQLFEIKELLFNITHHELVPKHTVILDDLVIAELVLKYQVKSKLAFPHLLKNDPVARYYALKSGNMVMIQRVSPSAGEHTIYRVCV